MTPPPLVSRRFVFGWAALSTAGLALACGGRAVIDGGGGSSAASGGGDSGCPVSPTPLGRICVRGTPTGAGETIDAETPLRIELDPSGCFSSSCTDIRGGDCELARSGDRITADGAFCLVDLSAPGVACTNDCFDITLACSPLALESGSYTIDGPDDLSLSFDVPSALPPGGLCDDAF